MSFDGVQDRIRSAERIVFVTGAGVSQESGIPTFRGKDGLWRRHDVMKLATIDAFYEDPKTVWEWYEERRRTILAAEPNPGHVAMAELERHADVCILTQNIDGLHQRAGSTRVLELHGSIVRVRCVSCGDCRERTDEFASVPPACGRCGDGMLRPDVVWFGEPLPQDVWGEAIRQAGSCDVMVIAGTSLEVSPANTLPYHARQGGAATIEVNPAETCMSSYMDHAVRGTCAGVIPEMVSLFGRG